MKRQTANKVQTFPKYTPSKVFLLRGFTDHLQINKKERLVKIRKIAKDLIRHFTKEDISMDKKHMERSLTSLVIRETQKAAITEPPERLH